MDVKWEIQNLKSPSPERKNLTYGMSDFSRTRRGQAKTFFRKRHSAVFSSEVRYSSLVFMLI